MGRSCPAVATQQVDNDDIKHLKSENFNRKLLHNDFAETT